MERQSYVFRCLPTACPCRGGICSCVCDVHSWHNEPCSSANRICCSKNSVKIRQVLTDSDRVLEIFHALSSLNARDWLMWFLHFPLIVGCFQTASNAKSVQVAPGALLLMLSKFIQVNSRLTRPFWNGTCERNPSCLSKQLVLNQNLHTIIKVHIDFSFFHFTAL